MNQHFSKSTFLSLAIFASIFAVVLPYKVFSAGIWSSTGMTSINSTGECYYEYSCSDMSGYVDPSSIEWNRSGSSCPTVGATAYCYSTVLDFDPECNGPNTGRSIDSIRTRYGFSCIATPSQFIDIGLRINEGTSASPSIQAIAIENPSGTLSSPLHIAKNGITYRVALVNVGDANATKALIRLANGDIKALRRF